MKLNRRKIQQMVDAGQLNIGGRKTAFGSGVGGGGGVSAAWVEENYISKEFFNRLFTVHGEDDNNEDVVVEPNDVETTITDLESIFGFWTEQFVSSLGLGGGGGGGGTVLSKPLSDINNIGSNPATAGKILVYQGNNEWGYENKGNGSVTSITLATPQDSGLLVSLGSGTAGNSATITDEGVFALSFETGYSLVSPTDRTNWDAAADVADVTWWGQSIQSQTSGGVTTKFVSGHMSSVGNITMSGHINMNRGQAIAFKIGTNSDANAYVRALRCFVNSEVLSLGYETTAGEDGGSVGTDGNGYATNIYGKTVSLFSNTSNGIVEGLTLDTSGNVGISRVQPQYKLDVNGIINCTSIRIGGITITADTNNGGLHVNSAGLYADTYISALGAGNGGGGGTVLTEPLATINQAGLGAPSGTGDKVISWNSTLGWHYANLSSGNGTVTSITAGTGLNGGTITTSGTLSIDTVWMNNNYLPLTIPNGGKTVNMPGIGSLTFKNTASDYPLIRFEGNTVGGLGFLGIINTNNTTDPYYVTAVNGAYVEGQSQWYKIWHSGNFTPSDYLTKPTGPYSAWGRTYYSNGAFSTISGNMTDVGSITMSNNVNMLRGNGIAFKTGTSLDADAYVIALRCFVNYEVLSIGYETTAGQDGGTVGTDGNGYATNIYGKTVSLFSKTSNGIIEGITLDTSGNVGISRVQPQYKLDVNGTINCTSIRIGGITITADTNNGGLHINSAGLYADTYLSALGLSSGGGGSVISLSDLTDVTISSPTEGQILVYNSTQNKWVNQNFPAIGDATKLEQTTGVTSLSTFYSGDALTYTAAGGGNTITDKPTGVNAFGVLSFKTAVDYHGQILVDAVGTMYVRSASSLSGGWQKVLTDSNYAFTSLINSGDEISMTIGGVTKTLEVGYATKTARLDQKTEVTSLSTFYDGNYLTYTAAAGGNTISDKPAGVDSFGILSFKTAAGYHGQILVAADGTMYVRSASSLSGGWNKVAYTDSTVAQAGRLSGNNSYTAWGRTYWSNGVPSTISGHMSSVGNITMSGHINMNRGQAIAFKIGTNSDANAYVRALRCFVNSEVLSLGYETTAGEDGGSVGTDGNGYATNIYGKTVSLFSNTSNGIVEGLTLDTSGNVGISRVQPQYKLDVNGIINCTSIRIGGITITADTNNGGLHINSAGLYADTYLSALGLSSGGGGSVISLSDLTDVTISSPTEGQILVYNSTQNKWVNQNFPAIGDATKLEQTTGVTSLSTFYSGDALTYTAAGGGNTITDKPTGVNAFGVLSFKTAVGYHGQILVDAVGTMYVRSASSLSGGWQKVLTDSNYAFTSLINSGDNISITIGGVTKTLEVGYATKTARLDQKTGVTSLSTFYDGNYLTYTAAAGGNTISDKPTGVDSFGILSFKTAAGYHGQILLDASGTMYVRSASSLSGGWNKVAYTDSTVAKADRLSGNNSYTAWNLTYWSNGVPATIRGTMSDVDDIRMNNNHFIRVLLSDGTTDINMMGIDSSNNISLFYGAYVNGLTPYIHGNEVGFATGSPSGSTYYSLFRSTGHLTINAYDNLDSTVFRNPTPFLIVGGGICGTGLFTNASVGETIKLHTTSTYNCIQFFTGVTSQWSVGTNNNGTFYWYTQPGGEKTVMSLTSGGDLGIGRTPGYKLDVNGSARVTDLWIGSIHITSDANGIYVANGGMSANTYVTALGQDGGGGGGVTLNKPLSDINSINANPSHTDQILVYKGSNTWVYEDKNSSSGTVTDVTLSMPTGFTASSSQSSGVVSLSVGFASGYSLPTTASQDNWNTAYTMRHSHSNLTVLNGITETDINNWNTAYSQRHTHSNMTVLNGITSTNVTNWDTAYTTADRVAGYFDANGNASSALKLTTVSKTAWGRTYWTSGGVPTDVSGDLTSVNDIAMNGKQYPTIYFGSDDLNCYIKRTSVSSTLGYALAIKVGSSELFNFRDDKFYSDVQIETSVGLLSSGYVTALSDIRYKDIQDYFTIDVNDIANASLIRFTWKDRKDTATHVGGIAQEWQTILPEAVIEGEDGRLSMDYGVIGVASVISLAKVVVNHEQRIARIEKKLSIN